MQVIMAQSVDQAYVKGIDLLERFGVREKSQYGDVIVAPYPVTTVYVNPTHRVLFNELRDANPVFHLMEAMWMLAGRKDVAFLDRYVADFSARFGEKDGTEHDAYGDRWRRHFGFDQLDEIVRRLRSPGQDRQCVLQMWDPTPEATREVDDGPSLRVPGGREVRIDSVGADDLLGAWRTRPCNTHAYFRKHVGGFLDLTVLCRSNDIIWGAYGSNVVHFSLLLEYVAARAGLDVGRYYQVSNNFHAYARKFDQLSHPSNVPSYPKTIPLLGEHNAEDFDKKLYDILEIIEGGLDPMGHYLAHAPSLRNGFLEKTVLPLAYAYALWRQGEKTQALSVVGSSVEACDWRLATVAWMDRRMKNV